MGIHQSESEDLSEMPYRDLQKRAKAAGIKANLPKQALIQELESHLAAQKDDKKEEKVRHEETLSIRKAKNVSFAIQEVSEMNEETKDEAPQVTPQDNKENPVESESSPEPKCFLDFVSERRKKRKAGDDEASQKKKKKDEEVPPSKKRSLLTPLTPNRSRLEENKNRRVSTPKEQPLQNKIPQSNTKNKASSSHKKPELTSSRIPRSKMPDFAKLHARQFEKMENLETYLNKRKGATPSNKGASGITVMRSSPRLSNKKPPTLVVSSPHQTSMKKSTLRITSSPRLSIKKQITETAASSPRLSIKKKLPFGTAASPRVAQKKPPPFGVTASPRVAHRVSSLKKPTPSINKKVPFSSQIPTSFQFGSSLKKPEALFTFSASPNKSLNSSLAKRNPFDLKQSLAQPLKFKPHTGKIKKWVDKTNERKAAFKAKSSKDASLKSITIKGVRMNRRAELMFQRRKAS
uniref:Nucleolar and spindle-associated protein 1 n=1 Tax=Caligus rogercresseyi TaxID=217165 RepID=C1BP79_CALRO|nr:Nucleolar and spindle-associated protein 1 [Caligus rogercresseyi]